MVVNVIGLVAVIVFYILILAVGIIAGRKSKSTEANADSEEVMVAGRNIGLAVGIFTMTGKTLQRNILVITILYGTISYNYGIFL